MINPDSFGLVRKKELAKVRGGGIEGEILDTMPERSL
jgi:hypothetical protein